MPPKVLQAAVQAAIAFAAKPVASALVSAQAAALAQGMLKTATIAKVSLVMTALLTTVAVCFGTAMGPGEKPGSGTIGDIVLSAQIPTPQPEGATARVDSLGDPLPPGAVARLGTLRFKHLVGNYSDEPFLRLLRRASRRMRSASLSLSGRTTLSCVRQRPATYRHCLLSPKKLHELVTGLAPSPLLMTVAHWPSPRPTGKCMS